MRNRITKALFGLITFCLIFLLAFEILLNLLGPLLAREQIFRNYEAHLNSKDKIRILCLGESTTASYGANGEDNSWPRLLEKKLNSESAPFKKKFAVFNEGLSGTDTSFILLRLPSLLERYRPHIVITMMGVNDVGTQIEYKQNWMSHFELIKKLKITKLINYILEYNSYHNSKEELNDEFVYKYVKKAQEQNLTVDEFSELIDQQNFLESTKAELNFKIAQNLVYNYTIDKTNKIKRQYCFDFTLKQISKTKNITYFTSNLFTMSDLCYDYTADNANKAIDVFSSLDFKISSLRDGAKHSIISFMGMSDSEKFIRLMSKNNLVVLNNKTQNTTQLNYQKIYSILNEQNIFQFAMMYPTGNLKFLYRIFSNEKLVPRHFEHYMYEDFNIIPPSLKNLDFITNENFNDECIPEVGKCYVDVWTKNRGGRFGHTTTFGHQLIANNVYSKFIKEIKLIDSIQTELTK